MLRRVWVAFLLLAGVAVPAAASHAASSTRTTSTTTSTLGPGTGSAGGSAAPASLPLYQFTDSGVGALPWSAQALTGALNNSTMLGGPHAAASSTTGVLAYRTANSQVALYTQPLNGLASPPTSTTIPSSTNTASSSPGSGSSATGTSTSSSASNLASSGAQWQDLSLGIDALAPASDPVPFFDPWGNVDVLYVSASGDLELLTPNDPVSALWLHTHRGVAWRATVSTDLSALSGVSAAVGSPSVVVSADTAEIALRGTNGHVVTLSLSWAPNQPIPTLAQPALDLTALTHSPGVASDPVVLSPGSVAVGAITSAGHLEIYGVNPSTGLWYAQDLTKATSTTRLVGALASTDTSYSVEVAGLSPTGAVILFSAPLSTLSLPPSTVAVTTTPTTAPVTSGSGLGTTSTTGLVNYSAWSATNVTAATAGSPPLSGRLFLASSSSGLSIAGSALGWGDLFVLQSPNGFTSWTDTDVSVTAGNAARTVAPAVTGLPLNGGVALFAAGISSPPPQGVGVYAIPSSKWTRAVQDGWPILSETGGLGTMQSPWVGFTSASSVASSPDYVMGQSIYSGHKRVTWLSYWTVSGPLPGESQVGATYYKHGFAAGAWVASQIDQYASLGEGLKPDWVILDPEGYPDAHSGLDAPSGSSTATLNLYATYWSAMLSGWSAGLNSVDPSLKPGIYATQSEYRNYHLANQALPVFMAIAFGGGGPIPVPGASGANVRGFIAFNGVCTPTSTLATQEQTLANAPWGGQFNTLQFNAGVYCPPAPF